MKTFIIGVLVILLLVGGIKWYWKRLYPTVRSVLYALYKLTHKGGE